MKFKRFTSKFFLLTALYIIIFILINIYFFYLFDSTSDISSNKNIKSNIFSLPSFQNNFIPLSEFLSPFSQQNISKRQLNICIVTLAWVGPTKTGGIGTAYTSLGETLIQAGHKVTVLYAYGEKVQTNTIYYWIDYYAQLGIKIIALKASDIPLTPSIPSQFVSISYNIYQWLLDQETHGNHFNVIHFHEWHGIGYYTIQAKHQQLAFLNSVLVTTIHCPSLFFLEGNFAHITTNNQIASEHLEKISILHSDIVLSPSLFMLKWIQTHLNWKFPPNTFFIPNLLTNSVKKISPSFSSSQHTSHRVINEFVFFARIEVLKGIFEFLNALDILAQEVLKQQIPNFNVTFLGHGNMGKTTAKKIIKDRKKKGHWPFTVNIINNYLQPEAIRYIVSSEQRLIILPSLLENSPYSVLECLYLSVPFIASNVGGIRELIDPNSYHVLFQPNSNSIANIMRKTLLYGIDIAKPSFSFSKNEENWKNLHSLFSTPQFQQLISPSNINSSPSLPPVSIILIYHKRASLILMTLHSLIFQDYPLFEIIMVDDGSDDPESEIVLNRISLIFTKNSSLIEDNKLTDYEMRLHQKAQEKVFRFHLLRQSNQFPGAARNHGAEMASTSYLLFIDDDDIVDSQWILYLMYVHQNTGSDVVTCSAKFFAGTHYPLQETTTISKIWLPIGNSISIGFFYNIFGAYSALFRRTVFQAVGGYSTEPHSTYEDWELFSNIVLKGYTLEHVSIPLLWYRQQKESHLLATTSHFTNQIRAMRPYIKSIPPEFQTLLKYAYGMNQKT